jgi:hypothetical protein
VYPASARPSSTSLSAAVRITVSLTVDTSKQQGTTARHMHSGAILHRLWEVY